MLMTPEAVVAELEKINSSMLEAERNFDGVAGKVHADHKMNAANLLHYLVLRSRDIRELQDSLHSCGLSSLASAESHIRGQLLEILKRLGKETSDTWNVCTYAKSKQSLKEKSIALFGEKTGDAIPYIMVTFDKKFANDYGKIKGLLQSGMNIARINCAHDDEAAWSAMIQHVRRASTVTNLPCKIYMDLAGPKIRTSLNHKKKLKIKEGKKIYLLGSDSLNRDHDNVIGCTIQEIPGQLKAGELVLFDDGLVETKVEKVEGNIASLRVIRISGKKPRLKPGKGINFPNSNLAFPVLSKFDKKCLEFIKNNADMVGFSFVKNADDIDELRKEIGDKKEMALVLKIETPEAVKNFPQLLFRSMQEKNIGVMIARGDLAVEIGFERLSEVQEEILWICEAAHLPVIWATQVLETLNKSGIATRSEVTDAAHAGFADCVMINKGAHVIRVIESLKDILLRSGGHHVKKRFTFRPLSIATQFMSKL
jgi:pyruvate kinase